MRKFILLTCILTCLMSEGRKISESEANKAASEFFRTTATLQKSGVSDTQTRQSKIVGKTDFAPYYVFNPGNNKGFVIISGDDRVDKVLGYSDKGTFDSNNLPPQLKDLLNLYTKEINELTEELPTHTTWKTMTEDVSIGDGKLLKTVNWGQDAPYNSKCPVIDNAHALTGCVATAMAIVMKYHNWPDKGRGQHRYYDYGTGKVSYFSFTDYQIDWDNILEEYTPESSSESVEAIGNLMYSAGQAVDMMYYPGESGAFFPFVAPYLRYHFFYDINCEYLESKDYSADEWKTKIQNEINNGCPVIYQGAGNGNHAFVCDGYENDMFHINWGWNGSANGYFRLSALDPSGFNFSEMQSMIVGIKPDESKKDFSFAFVDKGYGYDDCGLSTGSFISVENVVKDEPFDFACRILTVPFGFNGSFGLALTDADSNVKEVLTSVLYDGATNGTWPFDIMFEGCKISKNPEATDLIQLVAKQTSETKWLPVPGTSTTPTHLPVVGNEVKTATLNLIVNESNSSVRILDRELENGKHTVLVGNKLCIYPDPSSMVKITHNNRIWMHFWNDNSPYETILEDGEYTVELLSGPFSKEKFTIENSGTLCDKIELPGAYFIEELTLEGRINAGDLFFIRDNCGYLKKLNLENAEIEGASMNGIEYSQNELPSYSLFGLKSLYSIKLPSNTTDIESLSLSGTSLTGIEIPASVEVIATDAFQDVYSLNSVLVHWTTPAELSHAFVNTGCYNGGTLYVPTGTRDRYLSSSWNFFSNIIEKDSMDWDFVKFTKDGLIYNLLPSTSTAIIIGFTAELSPNLILPETIIYEGNEYEVSAIGEKAFFDCNILETCIISNTIVEIGDEAFYNCNKLKEITFGQKLRELPTSCFANCYSLEKADIPENIVSLGWGTFDRCSSLNTIHIHKNLHLHANGSYYEISGCKSITLDDANPYYVLNDNVLYSKDMKRLILCAGGIDGAITVPDGVESLSWFTFYNMPNLTEINLPSTIKEIGYNFVGKCPRLKHITIPDLVSGSDSETIMECAELESITFGRNFKGGQGIHDNGKLNHIILRNTEKVDIPMLFDPKRNTPYQSYTYYTDQLYPNVLLDKCKEFYVPGGCVKNFEGIIDCDTKPLWNYEIDRIHKKLQISPIFINLTIDKVTINGLPVEKVNDNNYVLDDTSDLTVVIDFTLLERQQMTTVYDAAFNALVPDSDLSSGITSVEGEINERNDVYNLQGICVRRNATKAEIRKLPAGIYIIKGQKIRII